MEMMEALRAFYTFFTDCFMNNYCQLCKFVCFYDRLVTTEASHTNPPCENAKKFGFAAHFLRLVFFNVFRSFVLPVQLGSGSIPPHLVMKTQNS